jgi:GDPmannose 4,6-dehydratase
MNPRRAIVTGATGQDGSYLVEHLLARGYAVIGASRQVQTAESRENLSHVACDITNAAEFRALLAHTRPTEVYNLAAMSSGSGMYDEAVRIGEVNGTAVAGILEAIRAVDPTIRLCQASSSELFGDASSSPQSEDTPFKPRSPYGAAKLYAQAMVRIYRERYGLFACSAILFNHESPRRRLEFVTRKVAHAAASIKLGLTTELKIGNLAARRDWGFAGDYMQAMWLMLQHDRAQDYVVATGVTHSVRDLCEIAFSHLDLDYRKFMRLSEEHARPPEQVQLVGDASRLRHELNWSESVSFRKMIVAMVDADLQALRDTSKI